MAEGVAKFLSFSSLSMHKLLPTRHHEEVTLNIPQCSFQEMVGVKYCPMKSFEVTGRSFQAMKMKNKVLIVFSSLSQRIAHTQGGNQVSSNFKHLYIKGNVGATLEVLTKMENNGIFVDPLDIVELLRVCIDLKFLEAGRRVHEYVMRSLAKPSVVVFNKLVEMYCELGDTMTAKEVLDEMPTRNLDSWNLMLLGLARNGEGKESLRMFAHMQENVMRPNGFTYIGVITACAGLLAVKEGLKRFESMRRDYDINPTMEHYVSVVDLLGMSRKIAKAKEVKEAGYVPDIKYVLHDLGTTLRIIKNLRVCEDCHNFVRILSSIENREIIVRDNKRFHPFRDGKCKKLVEVLKQLSRRLFCARSSSKSPICLSFTIESTH